MIAFTSDIHLGITSEIAVAELGDEIRASRPRALVLGGDVAEGSWAFARALDLLADVAPRKGYVLGNHDVWKRHGWASEELLCRRLPEIARERGYDALEETTWRIGPVAVVASMAWYDYTAIDPAFSGESLLAIERRKREFVNDAELIDWSWSDLDLAAKLREGVERRLAEAEADPGIERIVVATHVPIFEEQMPRRPGNARWGYSNAYFGHLALGALVARFAKVTDVVSGHTHAGRDAVVSRERMRPIRARVNGGEYGAPGWMMVE